MSNDTPSQETHRLIPGLHHVTAIASDPQANLDFYVGLLGLRLVKKTVNFDDPQAYHFYYGDGSPQSHANTPEFDITRLLNCLRRR